MGAVVEQCNLVADISQWLKGFPQVTMGMPSSIILFHLTKLQMFFPEREAGRLLLNHPSENQLTLHSWMYM
jgi:hypothetical protein